GGWGGGAGAGRPGGRGQRVGGVRGAARAAGAGRGGGGARAGVEGALHRAGVPVVAAHVRAGQEPYRPAQVVRGAHGGDGVRGVVHGERLPAVGGRAVQAAQVHADGGVHLGRGSAEHRGR